jgi:hypothetical protein
MIVLRGLTFSDFVAINLERHGVGEACGACGESSKSDGAPLKLYRDHEHRNLGNPRGLLCFRCNRKLEVSDTPEYLEALAGYLRRAADPVKEAA